MVRKPIFEIKFILLFVLASFIAIALITGSFRFIKSNTQSFRERIISGIQTNLSRNLSYSSIDPFFVNSITIRDIEVKNSDGKVLAKGKKLCLKFNIFNYFFMNEKILKGLYLEDGFIDFCQSEDMDLVNQILTSINTTAKSTFMPHRTKSFYFKGKNLGASFLLKKGDILIEKCYADLLFQDKECNINGRFSLSGKNLSNAIIKEFTSKIIFDSNYSIKKNQGIMNLRISDFKSDIFQIKKQAFLMSFDSKNFFIYNMEKGSPVDYSVQFDMTRGIVSANGVFQNMRPLEKVQFIGKYDDYNNYAQIVTSGNFNLIHNSKDVSEKLHYSVDMSIDCHGTRIPFEPECQISITGADNRISINNLTIQTDKGSISYIGNFDCRKSDTNGILYLDGIMATDDIRIDSQYSVNFVDGQLNMDSDSLNVNMVNLGPNKISANMTSKTGSFSLPALELSGKINEENRVSGTLKLSDYPVKTLKTIFSGPDDCFSEDLIAGVDVYFICDNSNFYLTSRDIHIKNRKTDDNLIDFSVTSTLDDIKVTDINLNYRGFSGRGYFDLADMRSKHCEFETFWNVNDTDYEFNGFLNKGENLFVKGLYGFILTAIFDKGSCPFEMRATEFPVFINDGKSIVDINVSGQVANEKLQVLSINALRLSNLNFLRGGNNNISISGTLFGNNLKLNRWTLADTYSTVSGTGEATFNNFNSYYGWLKGTGTNLNEEYDARVHIKNRELNIYANCKNSRVERFTTALVTGNLYADTKITGTIDDPVIDANVKIEYGTFMDKPFEVDALLHTSKQESRIISATGKYDNISMVSATGYVDWNKKEYSLRSDMLLRDNEKNKSDINFELDGKMHENGQWIINPATIRNTGVLKLSASRTVLLGYDRWNFDFSNNGDNFYICGGPFRNSIMGYYYPLDGTFDFDLKEPLFIACKIKGNHKGPNIDALLTDISVDVGRIGQLTRYDFFFPLSGVGNGVLRVSGNINNPEFWGVIDVTDLYFSIYSLPDIFGPVPASLYFHGKDILMPPVMLQSRNNQIYVDCEFMLESWYLEYFKVDVSAYGDQKHGLKVKDSFVGIDVDGYALGNFSISGMGDIVMIDGDITVNNCIVNLSHQKNGAMEFDNSTEFIVNLKLHSGTGVEFFWPTKKVPVLRAFASKAQNVDIAYDSSTNQFTLKGDVDFKGGDIFYFSNNFFIKEGKIIFNENQDKFDPLITINAELRTATRKNSRVKLLFLMDNTPLSHFQPRIESVPALSQSELYEIMGDTIMGGEVSNEERSTMTTLVNAGSYGTQLIGILRPMERTIKDLLNIDVFSTRAQLSDKIFNNRRNEEKSNVDMKSIASNTIFNNIDIFLGKSFGKYFFLEGTLRFSTWDFDTFEYYEYNMPNFFDMYLESEINLEANTPLFILNLGFYPKFGNLTDSILDTTIGLSWRFTF